jgi:glycerol-3-phosphate acyltransferase PlsY
MILYYLYYLIFIILGILIGGLLPSAFLRNTKYQINVFTHGSQNPGATNVYRTTKSKKITALILCLDAGKVIFIVLLSYFIGKFLRIPEINNDIIPIIGLITIFSHCYSPYYLGNGGKGIAATLGFLLSISLIGGLLMMVCW